MPFYVDPLCAHGMSIRGESVHSCHLFTDQGTLNLVRFGHKIGLKPRWLDKKGSIIHFDLTASVRHRAIAAGAIPVSREEAVGIWRMIRERTIPPGCVVCAARERMNLEGICFRCTGRAEQIPEKNIAQQERLF